MKKERKIGIFVIILTMLLLTQFSFGEDQVTFALSPTSPIYVAGGTNASATAMDITPTFTDANVQEEHKDGKLTYNWTISDGTPFVLSNETTSVVGISLTNNTPAGEHTTDVNFEATWTNSEVVATGSVSVVFKMIEIQLKSIDFLGTGNHTLNKKNEDWKVDKFADDGGTKIDYPEWQDTNKDGVPEKHEPVCYTKKSTPKMNVVFSISPTLSTNVSAKIRLKKGNTVLMTADVTLTGSEVSTNFTWSSTLEDAVQNKDYVLDWEYSLDGGTTYISLGTSVAKFFITYGTPTGSTITAKRINLVTGLCVGFNKKKDIVDGVWKLVGFAPLKFGVHLLSVWEMLDNANGGECIDISNLFVKMLQIMGLPSGDGNIVYLYPDQNKNAYESLSSTKNTKRDCRIGHSAHTYNSGKFHAKYNWYEKLGYKDKSGKYNNYEACFKYRSVSSDPWIWYAPGTNGKKYNSIQKVMDDIIQYTFWGYKKTFFKWELCNPPDGPGPYPNYIW